jgi:hypothetical protein
MPMGCPPDPVEVSIWRSGERIAELQDRYNSLRSQYTEAVEFAERLDIPVPQDISTWPEERFARRTDVSACEEEPYRDEQAQHILEANYGAQVKRLEIELCELRTRLQIHIRENTVKMPEKTDLCQRVLAAHAAHREEDRAQVIAWLNDRYATLEYYAGRPQDTGGVDHSGTRIIMERIEAEILRLQGLNIEELVCSREITEIQESRFGIPFLRD